MNFPTKKIFIIFEIYIIFQSMKSCHWIKLRNLLHTSWFDRVFVLSFWRKTLAYLEAICFKLSKINFACKDQDKLIKVDPDWFLFHQSCSSKETIPLHTTRVLQMGWLDESFKFNTINQIKNFSTLGLLIGVN